ncbi:hypothetical protein DMB38_20480 [Streptomyces sp. WAC 06738]|uniref:hypothetical protein n=1 Tax=Streptomyces sp. WAC 06738 TaxID=2203210 RepID=UPI000F71DA66|nr:hypothetical protein [Streptomyces sp. WAC 06738]AZM47847.1 hypothetical protein DMB38_20480 [Streptomyces sp. WAC 06738]
MTIDITTILPELPLLESLFEAMEWAEDEIEKAQARHGEPKPRPGTRGTGPIWNSFSLLNVNGNEMLLREPLYRAHCREILDRRAKGADTRPGTDAEMIAVLSETSKVAPLTSAAACLYMRLMARSVPEFARAVPEVDLTAYEKVHGRKADEYETDLRHKLRQADRTKK